VAHVGRQRQHVLVDVLALLVPRTSRNARRSCGAGRGCAATPWLPRATQPSWRRRSIEDAVDLPITDGLPQQLPAAGDEERQLRRRRHMAGALISVALQAWTALGCSGTNRVLPNLLCRIVSTPTLQVDIGVEQAQRLGDAQPRAGDQPEQRLHHRLRSPPSGPSCLAAASNSTISGHGRRAASSAPALDRRRLRRAPRWQARTGAASRERPQHLQPRAKVARSPRPALAWRAQAAIRSTVSGPTWPALAHIAREARQSPDPCCRA
jgi:hypothetical protein